MGTAMTFDPGGPGSIPRRVTNLLFLLKSEIHAPRGTDFALEMTAISYLGKTGREGSQVLALDILRESLVRERVNPTTENALKCPLIRT